MNNSAYSRELMDKIKEIGKDFQETSPSETVIGNMTRRMLKIVRDEYAMLQKGKQEDSDLQESLQKILTADEVDVDYSKNIPLLKPAIMEHIGEFLIELESRFIEEISSICIASYLLYLSFQQWNWHFGTSSRTHSC